MEFEPLPDEVFAIPVGVGRVPIGAPEFPGAIKELEPVLVWAGIKSINVSQFSIYGSGSGNVIRTRPLRMPR